MKDNPDAKKKLDAELRKLLGLVKAEAVPAPQPVPTPVAAPAAAARGRG
jgi:hypothetical protein